MPFPVVVPYRARPGLARLGTVVHGRLESRVLDADRDAPAALRAKLARLAAVPQRCVALEPALAADPDAVWRRVRAAANAIADAQAGDGGGADRGIVRDGDRLIAPLAGWALPARADAPFRMGALRDDARPVVDWIASRPPAERPLHALGLALQEDLAWIESASTSEPARATLLHVCWPSGWDPAAKVGLDFASLHAPVADAAQLREAALPLSRTLLAQGPFVRFVWTLAPDGAASRHPLEVPADGWSASERPWFRCERQVSLPIGVPDARAAAGAALFLIRLHRAPLDAVLVEPGRAQRLRDALASMSDAMLAYKGLAGRRDALLAALDAARAAHDPPGDPPA